MLEKKVRFLTIIVERFQMNRFKKKMFANNEENLQLPTTRYILHNARIN